MKCLQCGSEMKLLCNTRKHYTCENYNCEHYASVLNEIGKVIQIHSEYQQRLDNVLSRFTNNEYIIDVIDKLKIIYRDNKFYVGKVMVYCEIPIEAVEIWIDSLESEK